MDGGVTALAISSTRGSRSIQYSVLLPAPELAAAAAAALDQLSMLLFAPAAAAAAAAAAPAAVHYLW